MVHFPQFWNFWIFSQKTLTFGRQKFEKITILFASTPILRLFSTDWGLRAFQRWSCLIQKLSALTSAVSALISAETSIFRATKSALNSADFLSDSATSALNSLLFIWNSYEQRWFALTTFRTKDKFGPKTRLGPIFETRPRLIRKYAYLLD